MRHGAARAGLGLIEALRDAAHARGILRAECEDRDRIERTAGRHHAARAQATTTGLQTNEIVECRRNAPGAGRVGTEREAGQPHGHRVPTRPVANWSRLVLPMGIAPASIKRLTT